MHCYNCKIVYIFLLVDNLQANLATTEKKTKIARSKIGEI